MGTASQWLLRIGVALAFVYPPLNALSNPDSWVGYFPQFLLTLGIPPQVLLHAFGGVEILIAVWILSGWHIQWPATLAAGMLVAIVAFNLNQFEILFRDLAIALACLALAADAWQKNNPEHKYGAVAASSV